MPTFTVYDLVKKFINSKRIWRVKFLSIVLWLFVNEKRRKTIRFWPKSWCINIHFTFSSHIFANKFYFTLISFVKYLISSLFFRTMFRNRSTSILRNIPLIYFWSAFAYFVFRNIYIYGFLNKSLIKSRFIFDFFNPIIIKNGSFSIIIFQNFNFWQLYLYSLIFFLGFVQIFNYWTFSR